MPTKFGDLFTQFVSGDPIKRADWQGKYWRYERGVIQEHDASGVPKDILFTEDPLHLVSQFTQEDWEIATEEDMSIPIEEVPDGPKPESL